MNIREEAAKWLIEHEHYEHDPLFKNDLDSLCELIDSFLERVADGHYVGYETSYNPKFGDGKLCLCGHPYYRHFDTYDDMAPIGCKYCWTGGTEHTKGSCPGFKEVITIEE